jgi:subfamily B ATP-binding cassette protein MsbA
VAIALAVIIYTASNPTASHKMTAGDFTSYMASMLLLFPPFKRITSINDTLQRGLTAAESVFSFLALPSETNQGTQYLGKARGALRFEAVSLRYPSQERLALDTVTLEIVAGETVALVGASGGGKTSLANLIPRFYTPSSGSIYLDNVEITQLELQHLREQIAMVSQEVVLFNDTLAANIAYGKQDKVQEQDIIAAAQAAHAWEFIQEMPEGLQTIIGDNGVRLSGGQRQRLAIARAFLKNAPILILDEATSALDTQSERHVQAALEALMKNRTTLVIAHRLSTIEKADRIIVMQKGSIVEQGKHLDLLAKNGIYANLHNMQFNENDT